MDRRMSSALDRHITGNYGEDCPVNDKSKHEKFVCKWCGNKQKIVPTGLCPVCCRF